MKGWIFLLLVIVAGNASADLVEPDKRAHFIGGALLGGIGTAIADRYVPQHRFVAGVILGSLPGLAIEIGDANTDAGFSVGDLVADVLGAAAGALVTDKFILKPVVRAGANGYYGLAFEQRF